ncbi:MAG: glutamyl-Q tRNA(Asp) synthetase [Pseudorhodobacter sp.]|jgi:glutamyl-Q tRNA(Asp) synthetase
MAFVTRFAPSPTGPLHLGHAYSAILAHDMARAAGGAFRLRIDDLDQSRSRREWELQIYDDLQWLGITWDGPVRRQSECTDEYASALNRLEALGLTYACACSRRDIEAAAAAPQESALRQGPDGVVYPGTCRTKHLEPGPECAIRLHMAKACAATLPADFFDTGQSFSGRHLLQEKVMVAEIGDVILLRRQMAAAYHLAVVVDDDASDVTHVIRGEDLFEATHIHVLLQKRLGLATPIYHHHRLIRDDQGKRLAKRDDARAIATYRAEGANPADIRRMVAL